MKLSLILMLALRSLNIYWRIQVSKKNWELHSKKDITTRVGRKCDDCGSAILPGSFARQFTYNKTEFDENETNDDGTVMVKDLFFKKFICEDCEKYYRGNNEPRM